MPIDKGTHQGKLWSKNLDEAFCILKITGVLIEKTLMHIFSKIQLFEVQPCADPESYVRGGPTDFDLFLVDQGTIIGPPAKRHLNGVLLAGR